MEEKVLAEKILTTLARLLCEQNGCSLKSITIEKKEEKKIA